MADELVQAIYNEAVSDVTLMAAVVQAGDLGNGFYFDEAPDDATMPYIIYYMISRMLVPHFNAVDDFEDSIVQFSIFDDSPNSANIASIRGKLQDVFDRASLTYASKTAVGCLRTAITGPTRLEDANGMPVWQMTVDYRIQETV